MNEELKQDINPMISVVEDIVNKSFGYTDEAFDPLCIYVDLDSCLSILTANNVNVDDKYTLKSIISNTVMTIANFINQWKNRTNIKLYYSFKPTKKFNEYIPDWNKERNERLTDERVIIIHKQIISRLKRLSLSNILLIECDDSTIINIYKDISLDTKQGSGAVILSRDPHYQCLFGCKLPYIEIYDGKKTINKNIFRGDEKYPNISYLLIPYYYSLAGEKRNGYKRAVKWNKNKIIDYLTARIDKVASLEDEELQKHINAIKVFKLMI